MKRKNYVSRRLPYRERFMSRIDRTGDCWLWTGGVDSCGYGLFWMDGRKQRAHRLALEFDGRPIPDGLEGLHRCDNPPCVRPSHLWIGTKSDNSRDMVAKGRRYQPDVAGGRNPHARLTDEQAALIRRLHPRGKAAKAMAAGLGVSVPTITRVIAGTTYKPRSNP